MNQPSARRTSTGLYKRASSLPSWDTLDAMARETETETVNNLTSTFEWQPIPTDKLKQELEIKESEVLALKDELHTLSEKNHTLLKLLKKRENIRHEASDEVNRAREEVSKAEEKIENLQKLLVKADRKTIDDVLCALDILKRNFDLMEDTGEEIKPADTDEEIKPADTDKEIKPADTDEVIKPADTDEEIKPAALNNGEVDGEGFLGRILFGFDIRMGLNVFKSLVHSGGHGFQAGYPEPEDDVLYSGRFKSKFNLMRTIKKVIRYPPRGNGVRISAIQVIDNWKDGTNGKTWISGGGPFENFVEVTLESKFGRGLDFSVYIYGSKT